MSRAVAGAPYTIVSGDNLSNISAAAYGDPSRWREIWAANKFKLRSGDPNKIYPGEIINIPGDALNRELLSALDLPDLPGKAKDDFTLIISGLEIPVISATITLTMDTAADGWTALIPWTPGENEKLDKIIRPYSYNPASVFLGETMMIDGWFYDLTVKIGTDGDTAELSGYSFTADILDSSVTPPYEQKKVTLFDRAKKLVEHLGIDIVYDSEDTEIFKKVTASPSETIISHLIKLASQRGILISSTRKGQLLLTNAKVGKPVGTLSEGTSYLTTPEITWSGRDRYSSYRVVRKSRKRATRQVSASDDVVSLSRLKTFSANDTTGGNLQQAADWRRSKQLANALEMNFPVTSWYAPNGELWEENTIVTVVSPTLLMPDGFDFTIKSVDYTFDDRGAVASLSLIPPQAYTGDAIVEPWLGG